MKRIIKNGLSILAITVFFFQCNDTERPAEDAHEQEAHGGHEEDGAHENEDANATVVNLSNVQIASIDLEYGSLDTLNISEFVKANGILDLPPQNIAAVSAPMDGFVKRANYLVGDYVKKGAVLAVLEHLDYVKLQEEYLNVLANLTYLESEYERQRRLDSAEVTSKKQFEAATAAFNRAQIREQALEKQLQYIGLSPERVAKKEISTTISVRAPFSGYVTTLNVHIGTFAASEQALYELVNMKHMHLELNVFEQDINKVKIGQAIRFVLPSTGQERYQGEVFLVGKSFGVENKAVRVHGHIEGEHANFIRGLYVEAKIYTGGQQVPALPEEAVVEDEGKSYIFIRHSPDTARLEANDPAVAEHVEEDHRHEGHNEHGEAQARSTDGISFRRVQVVTGEKEQGYIEIKEMSDVPRKAEVVTKGAYFLFSEMKKGEGGHHHH